MISFPTSTIASSTLILNPLHNLQLKLLFVDQQLASFRDHHCLHLRSDLLSPIISDLFPAARTIARSPENLNPLANAEVASREMKRRPRDKIGVVSNLRNPPVHKFIHGSDNGTEEDNVWSRSEIKSDLIPACGGTCTPAPGRPSGPYL